MKRVLAPQGMLALNFWGCPENSPHVVVICDVFREFFGEDSTMIFQVACSLSNPQVLQNLVEDAGFSNIQIQSHIKIARHPSLTELLPAYFSIFPVAKLIAAMPEEERTRMFHSIEANLVEWKENEEIAVPTENYILTAEN